MYIKLIQPKKDGNRIYDNTGSVGQLVSYLSYEYKERGEKNTTFFNQIKDTISSNKVIEVLDNQAKSIKQNNEKFYSIIVNPSDEELLHIHNDDNSLRRYVRKVMENYANGFQLRNGKKFCSNDLVWYATIHKEREIKNIDLKQSDFLSVKEARQIKVLRSSTNPRHQKEIEHIIKNAEKREENKYNQIMFQPGDKKPGFNKHVHIIVSRKDTSKRINLNPRTRRAKFNIKDFQLKSGRDFQKMFGYEKETISKGFYQKYNEQDEEYFHRKIETTVRQMNQYTGEEKIEAEQLKEIGKECNYSRAFFINLTKLKYRFVQADFVHDPYFYARHGRDQKQAEYISKLDDQYPSHRQPKEVGEEPGSLKTAGINQKVTAAQMLQVLGSLRSGPMAIEETLMLDEEQKKMKRYQEKGRGGLQNEIE